MSLSKDDVNKFKSLYVETARSYLQNMQSHISYLLNEQQVSSSVRQVHLDAHSIKSQSQIMGYVEIAKISEAIESLFNRIEKENLEMGTPFLVRIQINLTKVLDSINEIEKQGKEMDLTAVVKELENIKIM